MMRETAKPAIKTAAATPSRSRIFHLPFFASPLVLSTEFSFSSSLVSSVSNNSGSSSTSNSKLSRGGAVVTNYVTIPTASSSSSFLGLLKHRFHKSVRKCPAVFAHFIINSLKPAIPIFACFPRQTFPFVESRICFWCPFR